MRAAKARKVVVKWASAVSVLSLTIVCPAADVPGGRLIGLLALRQLEGVPCEQPPRAEIALYASPESAAPIGWIQADRHSTSDDDCYRVVLNVHPRLDDRVRELPTEEYEEERPTAAIVVERRDRWFKVRLAEGAAWLHASDRDEYFSLQELLVRRPAYLTEAWDGTLAQSPDGPRRRLPADPRRRVIGYATPALKSTTPLHALERPEPVAPVIVTFQVRQNDAGPLRAARRSPPEVPVFARRPGWLEVALEKDTWREDQRVWIEDASWRFHALDSAAAREEFEDDVFGREHSLVRLVDSREVGAALWLRVEVMSHTIYESPEPQTVVATGWVPAHDPAGKAVVWAHSRD